MNKAKWLVITGTLLASTMMGLAEKLEADIDGATPGKWTMDFEAAKKLAAEKKLPILLDFSGSDWCGWCKIMEDNVFTKPEWAAYATNNLVMVLLDFPSDKSLVPEKYVARNMALKDSFSIEGFPTFIVLDDDGITELGRLTAGREKTPASFQNELKALFSKRAENLAKFAETLNPEDQARFTMLTDRLAKSRVALKTSVATFDAAKQQANELVATIGELEKELRDFRVGQLDEALQVEYKALSASFEIKQKALEDWIGTQPERSEENMAKFQSMQNEIQTISAKLEAY